jgi:mono/diheme cytochrome c family protein
VRRIAIVIALMLPLSLLVWAGSQNPRTEAIDEEAGARSAALNVERDALIVGASAQVLAGAEQFDLVCAACHGDTGLGYDEGKLSFPQGHQRCVRCHRPNNPDRIADTNVSESNSFHIGDPPALRGEGTLAAFPTGAALHGYIRAAMPRHAPGSLDDEVYLDLTAFLLALRGEVPVDSTLTVEGLASTELHGAP